MQGVYQIYSTKAVVDRVDRLVLSKVQVRLLARTGVPKTKKVGRDWVVLELDYRRKSKSKGSDK